MKYIYNLAFKMSLSATVALLISNGLNLEFNTVSAVIAILSVQDTKVKSLKMGKNRIIAGTIAIILSWGLYKLLGQNPFIFGLFLLIFIPTTSRLKIQEGMVPAVVLSTHLLVANTINLKWIVNEVLLMFIGVGVASIANLFMPALDDKFNKYKEWIEENYSIIISKMAKTLVTYTVDIDEEYIMESIEEKLRKGKELAYKIYNNNILKESSYHIDYINMRINQYDALKRMRKNFDRFNMSVGQMELMSKFTYSVAENIFEFNDCENLLFRLDKLKEQFKEMELPKTRAEFENRAQLLQFLNDIEDFLVIKRNFIIEIRNREK